MENFPQYEPFISVVPTCVMAGLCRSAVTVAEEADGTSRVGGFEKAGVALLPLPGGSAVLGVGGCWPGLSVKVTDLFWSPRAAETDEPPRVKRETPVRANGITQHQR